MGNKSEQAIITKVTLLAAVTFTFTLALMVVTAS